MNIPIQTNSIARVINALFSAVSVTFALLLLMQFLIANDLPEPEGIKRPIFDAVFYKQKVIEDIPEDREEIIEPVMEPLLPESIQIAECSDCIKIQSGVFNVDPVSPLTGIDLGGSPLRLVAASPIYPTAAITRGTEGYVDIQFDITKSGVTANLKILDYQPSTVFNRAVLRAVAKWRYRPKMVEGQAVPVVGVVERVSFELEK